MAANYLNFEDALGILGIENEQLESLIANEEIKAFRTQGAVKFKEEDLNTLKSKLERGEIDDASMADLPLIEDDSEHILPMVEDDEEMDDSDFTIELPDDVSLDESGEGSVAELNLDDDDNLSFDVDDSEQAADDIDISGDDLDLDLDLDDDDDFAGDLTVQEEAVATSDMTVQEDAIATNDMTVQEDAINTSELTIQEDAINTSEMTAFSDDGMGTEAGLEIDDFEDEEDDEEEEERSVSGRRNSRRSGRATQTFEGPKVSILWSVFLGLTLLVNIWSIIYVTPYIYYRNNVTLPEIGQELKTSFIPKYLKGQVKWVAKNFRPNEKPWPSVSSPFVIQNPEGRATIAGDEEEIEGDDDDDDDDDE